MFNVDSIDILKRRNKENDKCLEDASNFGDIRIKQVIDKVGFRAIYHRIESNAPICDADN